MKRVLAAGLLIGLAGCVTAAPPCPPLQGPTDAAGLTCRAERGDKRAALALGRLYEDGDGVSADPARAARLYRQAASFTSGTTWIYVPPAGNAKTGSTIPVRTGPDVAGLPEAWLALARLQHEGRGVRRDPRAACRSAERALRGGVAEARAWMAEAGCAPRD